MIRTQNTHACHIEHRIEKVGRVKIQKEERLWVAVNNSIRNTIREQQTPRTKTILFIGDCEEVLGRAGLMLIVVQDVRINRRNTRLNCADESIEVPLRKVPALIAACDFIDGFQLFDMWASKGDENRLLVHMIEA